MTDRALAVLFSTTLQTDMCTCSIQRLSAKLIFWPRHTPTSTATIRWVVTRWGLSMPLLVSSSPSDAPAAELDAPFASFHCRQGPWKDLSPIVVAARLAATMG